MSGYRLEPRQLLVVDDMKPGFDMARSRNVPFACAGWSHHDPQIAAYMRSRCKVYLNTPQELEKLLFETENT